MSSLGTTPKIRLANVEDLPNINQLFKEIVYDINNVKKINMLWNDEYPFCVLEKSIKNKEMYLIEFNNKIIGSFTLSTFDNPSYHAINWTSNNKWFYLNRLVVLPSEQGKGYAKYALKFVDKYAMENNYKVIRLTVHKDNKYAIGLYEQFGFIKIKDSNLILDNEVYYAFEKEVYQI